MSFLGASGTFSSATPRLIEHSIAFTFGRDPYWRKLLFTEVPTAGCRVADPSDILGG